MNLHQYLTANLEALSARKEPAANWLAHGVKDIEGALERVFVNHMGLLDWRMDDGLGLIAKCPPLPVLYDEWRKLKTPEKDATVIVGVNLGYGLNHVLTGTPNSHKVLVIEPRPEMLLACLGQTDYRPFLEIGKLRFIVPGHDQVEAAIQRLDLNLVYGNIHLRNDIPSQQIGPEYAQVSHMTRGKLENFSVELATLRLKQEVMVGNELSNYAQAMNDGSLLPLRGMAQGVTAVILGAGPSLAETGPRLAADPGHALYASALQTLPALERVGLKPHFCLAIDFRQNMMRLYDNLRDTSWLNDLPLIYSTKMDPEVVKRYPGPKIPLWTMGGIGTYVFKDHELVLDAGGNVGVTLARFLSWCGVSRILLAGQDFSWPGDRSHAPGHHSHENVQTFDPANGVEMTNLWGQKIYSNVGYLSAKRDLEKDLRKAQVPVYNIYGGGVEIEGARAVDVEECRRTGLLASQPGARERFLDAVRRANQPRVRPVYEPRHNNWNASLRNATRRFEKLMKKPGKHQGEMKQLLNSVLHFIKQDPLYLPYLFNEVMDMAAMVNCRDRYAPTDMKEYRDILKRALEKVKRVDQALGPEGVERTRKEEAA
ncbi:MAG: motility associated factor glycosyltransferase family protein [Thermodesulfobacteriota bacterium]